MSILTGIIVWLISVGVIWLFFYGAGKNNNNKEDYFMLKHSIENKMNGVILFEEMDKAIQVVGYQPEKYDNAEHYISKIIEEIRNIRNNKEV